MKELLLGAFLQALREAGHTVGVREHEVVLRLLAAYDGSDVNELGELLVALLGGDEEGAGRVRRAFAAQKARWPTGLSAVELVRVAAALREWAGDGRAVKESAARAGGAPGAEGAGGMTAGAGPGAGDDAGPGAGGAAGQGGGLRRLGRGLVGLALAVLLVLLGEKAIQWFQHIDAPDGGLADPVGPRDLGTAAAPPPNPGGGAGQVRCPPPEVSEQRVLWRGALVGLLMMGLLLALQALPQRRLRQRDERRERSRRALARTLGPKEFTLLLPGSQPLIHGALREAVDDLVVTLARLGVGPGQELDLERVLAGIGRSGFVLEAPLQERRSTAALVLLMDRGRETLRYHAQVDALRAGLRARGLVFTEVGLHPRGERVELSLGLAGALREALPQLEEALAHGAVLLVSAGGPHLADYQRGQEALWLRALAVAPRRGWLHPSADPRRFELRFDLPKELPLRAWPLSAAGVREVQVELRGGHSQRDPQALLPAQAVGARERETLLRLLSMDPRADEARLDWLRGRHAKAVPAEAVVDLWQRYGGEPRGYLKMKLEELQGALARQREEEARGAARLRERVVRWDLLEAYRESEPRDQGSVAHLRWRLAVALQQIQLRGEPGDEALAAVAQRELEALARSKLWREVEDALSLALVLRPELPAPEQGALARLQEQIARDELPLPPLPGEELAEGSAGGEALGRALDHWAPALLWAGLVAAALDLGLLLAGPAWLWLEAREPVRDAYELKLVRGGGSGMLVVGLREVKPLVRPEAAQLRLVRCAEDGSAVPVIEKTQLDVLSSEIPLQQLSKLKDGVYQAQGRVGRVWHLSNELLVQEEMEPPVPAGDMGTAQNLGTGKNMAEARDLGEAVVEMHD